LFNLCFYFIGKWVIMMSDINTRDAPDTGTDLAGYPANHIARYGTGYPVGFSAQILNIF
jgi:hypothetical protein